MEKTASQDTLDETFHSMSPLEVDEVPSIEKVDTPPVMSTPKPESKIKQRLSSFASPFKVSKNSKKLIAKTKSLDKEDDGDSKKTNEEDSNLEASVEEGMSGDDDKKKKKKSARSKAGALVRKIGSLGGKKHEVKTTEGSVVSPTQTADTTKPPDDARSDSINDESGSHYDSVDDAEMQPVIDHNSSFESEKTITPQTVTDTKPLKGDSDNPESNSPVDITAIATDHPISTKPFAVSTWKPKNKSIEIEKPIESPSPEDALRRRIAFVKQATYCLSEDKDDSSDPPTPEAPESPATKLTHMVELAKLQRNRRSSSLGSKHDDKTDDEEYEDTEEISRLLLDQDMSPPYGDLIDDPEKKSMGAAPSLSHPVAVSDNRREYLYKILVIGELGTGKTSIIKRYVHQFFSQHYRATIGVDFALKVLNWDANTTIRLQLWDIAGQERFGNMTRVYYKEAVGAFIVFDVSRVSTFEAVVKWKQDLDSKVTLPDGSQIPCVLLGNKCDQQKEGLVNNPAKMDEFCKEKGFCTWFETSAKENINIEEAARALVTRILNNENNSQGANKDFDRILLEERSAGAANAKKCNC